MACQLLYKLLGSCGTVLYESVAGCLDQQDVAPTYIIIIHNSTLNNCVFGNNNGQHINAECQYPPSNGPDRPRHEAGRCSCRCGQQGPAQSSSAPQRIQVHSSDLEDVIIGDNNTLTVEKVDQDEERKCKRSF